VNINVVMIVTQNGNIALLYNNDQTTNRGRHE